ncbi:hypothetical protein CDL15_Pgr011352 [Punica granatum]|uniref:SAM domain-containing protein n=1 Tax=Punica granatum TaxID=22663 RepID=A0A218WEH5_PUNGR|nr:hypothetical protein CDL15_Pgr011352 [Punica granatum]
MVKASREYKSWIFKTSALILILQGGLSNRWLVLLGLGQFVQIFEGRSVNKFQLACLAMYNLKDMGAIAVDTRRKLMHTIDSDGRPENLQVQIVQNTDTFRRSF